jgi:hypothetical protein
VVIVTPPMLYFKTAIVHTSHPIVSEQYVSHKQQNTSPIFGKMYFK